MGEARRAKAGCAHGPVLPWVPELMVRFGCLTASVTGPCGSSLRRGCSESRRAPALGFRLRRSGLWEFEPMSAGCVDCVERIVGGASRG